MSKRGEKSKAPGGAKRLILLVAAVVLLVGGYKLFDLYQRIYWPNVQLDQRNGEFFIPTGSDLDDVAAMLESQGVILNRHHFEWVAERKNYKGNLVVPGKYILSDGMSNDELIDMLRAGNGRQEVRVTFNNIRTLSELSGRLGKQLEPDSLDFEEYFGNPEVISQFGFSRHTFITMFIPNTYRMDWASSVQQVVERMAAEYRSFWTSERKEKARSIGLSQSEVVTLASIVQAEQRVHIKEQPTIAGLYLNRLRKGMKLQSDPTVIFSTGDFSINRVLNKHLNTDSPYNTYRYTGLPPGPILLPEISAVDAVLNAEKHHYIFMCAREDFTGYHYFASSLSEHNRYAARYRKALNERKIYE